MIRHQINIHSFSSDKYNLLKNIRFLYESAFPDDERRDFDEIIMLLNTESDFQIDIFTDENNQSLGFISHWHFTGFAYVEHFAVDQKQRGKGFGKLILNDLLSRYSSTFILEVEKPENEISIRRIRFYENMGFKLDERPYLQPAYAPEKKSVPLFLMSNGEFSHENVTKTLHERVYKVNKL